MSDDSTTRILAVLERLEQGQSQLRTDLMARISRVQSQMDSIDERLTMGLGHADQVDQQSRAATQAVPEDNRLLGERVTSLHKLIRTPAKPHLKRIWNVMLSVGAFAFIILLLYIDIATTFLKNEPANPRLEQIWNVMLSVGAFAFIILLLYIATTFLRNDLESDWKSFLIDKHPLIFGLPTAATTAFGLVAFFGVATPGPIDLNLWGLHFTGPAGPLVMWIITFLSLCLAILMLKGNE
jgi:amino acid transporter